MLQEGRTGNAYPPFLIKPPFVCRFQFSAHSAGTAGDSIL
ncbi:hypothetical protein CLOLEP_00400 [[Clostridium] leptum DSM 753]|uniref:Uncharacterized protein n=1 Tax=[Clostridium] leptum DSM 753 TaxID=428125 RepID=A7VPC4_9FIRM|nr:hypothetical protein CLOLEP_00400 [[Clostridium] leptum DSM 753]